MKGRTPTSESRPGARMSSKNTRGPVGELTVYLAGGFHSGWQRKILASVPTLLYLDPSEHGLTDPVRYTKWDLDAIRRSDVVFAYLEATNPAGYALALEVGFAKGLGKTVILVDEKSSIDDQSARHLSMVRAASDAAFSSLDEGVAYLKQLAFRTPI